jgi:hypothetical protein
MSIYTEDGEEGILKQIDEKFLPILSKQEGQIALLDNISLLMFDDTYIELDSDLKFTVEPDKIYSVILDGVTYNDLIPRYSSESDTYVIGNLTDWNGFGQSEDYPFATDGQWFGT